MKELAAGVWQLSGFPADNINKYLIGDVLIDSGTQLDKRRILRDLEGRDVAAHALTHAHPDHYGSSHAICRKLGIPMWCGAADVEAVEHGRTVLKNGRMAPAARSHPVARPLKEGDEIGGFTVLDTPGHSAGHVSYWRESDKVLLCGDVVFGYNPFTMSGGPRPPVAAFTVDVPLNNESARRLAALEPELVCFGHGPPLRDPAAFAATVAKFS